MHHTETSIKVTSTLETCFVKECRGSCVYCVCIAHVMLKHVLSKSVGGSHVYCVSIMHVMLKHVLSKNVGVDVRTVFASCM